MLMDNLKITVKSFRLLQNSKVWIAVSIFLKALTYIFKMLPKFKICRSLKINKFQFIFAMQYSCKLRWNLKTTSTLRFATELRHQ